MTWQAEADNGALRHLRSQSEARGYTFYLDPPREVVPKFLGDFQPDALAVGPEGGIVIEVKTRRGGAPGEQLAEIAKLVSRERGWEFRAIYLNRPDESPSIRIPTSGDFEASFMEMERLMAGGHRAATLVMSFGVLEALARVASGDQDGGSPRSMSPMSAVQLLAENGYLENDVAERFRQKIGLRNAIVHGDLVADVSADDINAMIRDLKALIVEVESNTLSPR